MYVEHGSVSFYCAGGRYMRLMCAITGHCNNWRALTLVFYAHPHTRLAAASEGGLFADSLCAAAGASGCEEAEAPCDQQRHRPS